MMDLSELIATIVTSTAALIAIIGGFLISRVITLASEQSGIRRRLREMRNDIFAKEIALQDVKNDLLDEDGEDFIEMYYKKIIFEGKSINDIFRGEMGYRGRTINEMEPYVQNFQEVFEDISKLTNAGETLDRISKKIENPYDLKYPHRKRWYKLLFDDFELIKQEKERTTSPWATAIEGQSYKNISTNTLNIETERYEQKNRDCTKLKDVLTVLRIQFIEQNKIFEDYGKPKGLWWGLFVLAYASVVGIAYPISLLPYQEGINNDAVIKKLLLSFFYSQLAFLFIYLGIYMFVLTKKVKEPTLDLDTKDTEALKRNTKETRRLLFLHTYMKTKNR